MEIASLEHLMQGRGLSQSIIEEITASTEALPPLGILESLGNAPTIAGLSPGESELLLIRMLERVGAMFDARLTDDDIPELAGLPGLDDLLDKISNPQVANLLRNECARLVPNIERLHERV